MDDAVLVDSSVPIYALGDPGVQRERARAYLTNLASGRDRAYASVEMIQETAHHRLRRTGDRARVAREMRRIIPSFILLNFDREVLDLSLELIDRTGVRGRDAVHAATALAYGIPVVASPDPAFDGVPGIRRLDPLAVPV